MRTFLMDRHAVAGCCLFALALASAGASAHGNDHSVNGSSKPEVLAPFYTGAEYEPPVVGTYDLPSLGKAPDGEVLNLSGKTRSLHELMDGKVVLLSFIYTSCSDVNGCPLATAVIYKLQKIAAEDPELREDFLLLSLSFDPAHDTPEVMRRYSAGFHSKDNWRFLTTESQQQLEPILTGYGQSVIRDYDAEGKELPSFSHILRVFLIDQEKRIRNIYSVSFLYPELIVNDVKTVLRENKAEQPLTAMTVSAEAPPQPKLSKPGDYKEGYGSADYTTRAKDLQLRKGKPADLMAFVEDPPLGLPSVPVPEYNPLTDEKVALGRKLFFDRRLSLNDTFSCAMCHIPEQGFTSNEMATAVGVEGRSVRRNAPTIYNVAYHSRLFHDGREENLEQQIWDPLLSRNEMANPSVGVVLGKIRSLPDYDGRFEAIFGRGPTMETLGMALASYERTLVSGNSPFDRWHYGGEEDAVPDASKRGFELFIGKANCSGCHLVGKDYALFTDDKLHNTGLGYRVSMGIQPATERVALAPGVFVDVDREIIDSVGEKPPADIGLYEITQNPHDRWKYKTPTLRNVALTAPYMHNGAFSTLEEVVRFYNRGGVPNELLDPLIEPLDLTDAEVVDLTAFLLSLTGSNVDTLVSDAFAAPVGDISEEDPHWAHEDPGNPN